MYKHGKDEHNEHTEDPILNYVLSRRHNEHIEDILVGTIAVVYVPQHQYINRPCQLSVTTSMCINLVKKANDNQIQET